MLLQTFGLAAMAMTPASAFVLPGFAQTAIDSGLALAGLNSIALLNSFTHMKGTCNLANVKVRQEWRTLTPAERKNYIAAVKCVMAKPSILPPGQAPGSKSFYDDFVWVYVLDPLMFQSSISGTAPGTRSSPGPGVSTSPVDSPMHMNQTIFIHQTGNFLTWHRYYIHVYEQKLQQCGYTGNLPYWEWGYDVNSPRDSPVFDGSDTSMGSDGAAIPHQGMQLTFPTVTTVLSLPPGTGGGCVTKGPFKDMVVRLGPVGLPQYGSTNSTAAVDPNQDNPRCLKRDLNPGVAKKYNSFRNTTELILGKTNIKDFQGEFTGDPRTGTTNLLGGHGGGHFTMGGDPGSDPFISPGDPAFYLHHAQVDRVYWIWQNLDFAARQNVWGTTFFMDLFPSPNTTVKDIIDIKPLTPTTRPIKDLMDTVGGSPFCYVYI